MLKKKLILFIFLIFSLSAHSLENKILVKVDNKIITSIDIFKETQYLIAINENIQKLPKNKIFEIAKNSLIKNTIKRNEISKYITNTNLNEKLINQLLQSYSKKLGFQSKDEFLNHLRRFDLNADTIKKRLNTDMLWNDLIINKFSNRILIDKKKIKDEIIKDGNKIRSFLLSEIVFDLSSGQSLEKKFDIIENEILMTGFENSALIHSISDTSSLGGKLGWIKESSLNKSLKRIISNLKIGSHSKPIRISSGFLVLKVENIKEIDEELDVEKELNKRIANKKNEQLNQLSLLYYNKIKKDVKIDQK